MNCTEFRRELETARDERHPPRDPWRPQAAAHASECPNCAQLLADEDLLWRELARLKAWEPVVPPGFASAVRRRISEQRDRPRIAAWPFALSGLASAAALSLLVLVSWRETRPSTPAAASRAAASPSAGPARTAAGGASPVLWSDGRVEVVSGTRPAAPPPSEAPVAVLVEYHL